MTDFSAIKSEKLRKLIEASLKFTALNDAEQATLIQTISQFSPETQEKIYCPFFENQNSEEGPQNEQINKLMFEEYVELDKKLTMVERADLEEHDKGEEKGNMDAMLEQLKTV